MKWLINPTEQQTITDFIAFFRDTIAKKKHFQVTVKEFNKRSLDQNALFHVWVGQYFEFITNVKLSDLNTKQKSKAIVSTKRGLKRACYADTHWKFLLTKLKDPFTGKEDIEAESTTNYDVGEMYQFMEWVQNKAAQDGLILEALGQFKELKKESRV